MGVLGPALANIELQLRDLPRMRRLGFRVQGLGAHVCLMLFACHLAGEVDFRWVVYSFMGLS